MTRNSSTYFKHIFYKENLPYKSRFSNCKLLHDKTSKRNNTCSEGSITPFHPWFYIFKFFNSANPIIDTTIYRQSFHRQFVVARRNLFKDRKSNQIWSLNIWHFNMSWSLPSEFNVFIHFLTEFIFDCCTLKCKPIRYSISPCFFLLCGVLHSGALITIF